MLWYFENVLLKLWLLSAKIHTLKEFKTNLTMILFYAIGSGPAYAYLALHVWLANQTLQHVENHTRAVHPRVVPPLPRGFVT